jgi:GDP-L-fucose synthase
MDQATRIYVAGHRGLAGGAIVRELAARGYRNVLVRARGDLDLEDTFATRRFFERERPEVVFVAAGRVGGIAANNSYPVDFLVRNIRIETNVIEASHTAGARRLIFLGSSCIYPRDCPQPMREEYLLTGPLEATNRPYALAKIAGIECCWSYNRQYGTRFLAVMPTNLYGLGDNYDPQGSHVLPALIRKVHAALSAGQEQVAIWGSGTPRREFLYADDLARALVFLAELDDARFAQLTDPAICPMVNVGTGTDLTIRELAQTISQVVGFGGTFVYDRSKPDGTPRKVLDVSRIRALGWAPRVSLQEGIGVAYQDFLERVATVQDAL